MQDFALPSDRLASQRKDIVQTHGWKQRIYRKGRYCTQGLQVQQGRKQARVCNHPNMTFHHPTRTSGSAPITGREGHRKPQELGLLRNIAKRKHQPLSGRFRAFSARFPAGKIETSDFFGVKCRGFASKVPWFSSKKSDVLRQKHRAFWHFPLFSGCFQATSRCDYAHFSPSQTATLIYLDCKTTKLSPKSAPERTPKSVKIFEGRRQF